MANLGWIYTLILFLVLAVTFVVFIIKHKNKKNEEQKKEKKSLKEVLLAKTEMFSLVLFIFAMFLLDVNVNKIAAFGVYTQVTVFGDLMVYATSMFWLGLLIGLASFISICLTSMAHRTGALKKIDLLFTILGGVSLGIILSGGLLLFGQTADIVIPFFGWNLSRVSYYHIGIALEAITVLYFALTK